MPLDKSLPENEIQSLIERSEVEAICYSKKYDEIMKKMKDSGIRKIKNININGFRRAYRWSIFNKKTSRKR